MDSVCSREHVFHFKLDQPTMSSVNGISLFEDSLSFSARVLSIFERLFPFIEKVHFEGGPQFCCYESVCGGGNKEAPRRSVYVTFPESLYKRLKLIFQDLNFFSIAQVVRLVIRQFLYLVGCYGDDVETYLEKERTKWEKTKTRARKNQKPIRQLLKTKGRSKAVFMLKTIYDELCRPELIYLC